MEILRSLEEAAAHPGPSVVTIGSFDGIHLAHWELLRRVRQLGRERNAASVAITFDPHPVQVLAPHRAPKLLTPLSVKLELLEKSGIDRLLILPFTKEFSFWSPERFVDQVLHQALGAVDVVIGDNFRFGHEQAGTPELLRELGALYRFRTEVLPKITLRGMTVSSSQIRALLEAGKVRIANRLLGRCFSIRNAVAPGLGIGRSQTVPTLNLAPYAELMPAAGVYITWTRVSLPADASSGAGAAAPLASRQLRSVTNVGRRPTFGERELGVETHLLESWQGSAPPEMEVSFLYRLRDERKFSSPEELRSQIVNDVHRAETYFHRLDRMRIGTLRG